MLQQPSHLVFAPRATKVLSTAKERGTQLSAPWTVLARAGWLAITLPALSLFLAALPLRYAQIARALAAIRPSLGGWSTLAAVANLGFEVLFVGTSCAVATLIFWHKSSDWLALMGSLFLVLFSIQIPPELNLLAERQPVIALFSEVVAALAYICAQWSGIPLSDGAVRAPLDLAGAAS